MRMIWKFPLDQTVFQFPGQAIIMPASAKIMAMQVQARVPCLWADLDPTGTQEMRLFRVFGTGHALPQDCVHVGTWQDPPYVWHLYELAKVVQ